MEEKHLNKIQETKVRAIRYFPAGIICGPHRDHLRFGIICGRGSFAALYRSNSFSDAFLPEIQ